MAKVTDEQLEGMARYICEHMIPTLKNTLQNATKSCPNCEHWTGVRELCGLNMKRPPATVIAFGCECFEDNGCPF
jgi:hypothetical protein